MSGKARTKPPEMHMKPILAMIGAMASAMLAAATLLAQEPLQQVPAEVPGDFPDRWPTGKFKDGLPSSVPADTGKQIVVRGAMAASRGESVVVEVACRNTEADQAEMAAAINRVSKIGGTIILGPGTCRFDDIPIASNVSVVGSGRRVTFVQATDKAHNVFNVTGTMFSIVDMTIKGAPRSTGGIYVEGSGVGQLLNVEINDFTATHAVALWVKDSSRISVDRSFIFNNYKALKLSGIVTTFWMSNSELAVTSPHAVGSMIDMTSGTAEAYFDRSYFESGYGAKPIICTNSAYLNITNSGFEDMAVNPGYTGSIANPSIITAGGGCFIRFLNNKWSGFTTKTQNYTGDISFFALAYEGTGVQYVQIDNNIFYQGEPIGGHDPRIVTGNFANGHFGFSGNYASGPGWGSEFAALRPLATVLDFNQNGATAWISNNTARYIGFRQWGFAQQLGSLVAPASATAKAAVLDSFRAPARSFGVGRVFKWTGCGRKTGSTGNKSLSLSIAGKSTDGSSYTLVPSKNDGDAWCATVNITFNSGGQILQVDGTSGVTPSRSVSTVSMDSASEDLTFSIIGKAASGNSITLDSSIWTLH